MAAGLTGAVLLAVTAYVVRAETALVAVRGARPGALLSNLKAQPAVQLDRLSDETVRAAIAAAPLDQRVVNVAMARDARLHGDTRTPAWLEALSRLGWRDTLSLQNRLYAVALRDDLLGILDITDALLRRRQLSDQIIPIVSLLEGDARSRPMLVQRLAGRPKWREQYLGTVGHLATREQLLSRVALLNALERHGALAKGEVVPSINSFDRAGLTAQAFALWQRVQPGVTRPLDDGHFDRAGRSFEAGEEPVLFQWQLMTGEGFSADVTRNGAQAALTIDWSGRGVPMFAQQRTSAMPGRYALDLEVPAEKRAELPAFSFRLACGNATIPFAAMGVDPTRLRTMAPVPCAFPTLQIAGDLQSSTVAHQMTINHVALRPLGTAPEAH
ncbi:MAG: hypothetical protein PGN16_07485 [Sphingomonas phyllosphaerae]